MMLWTLYWERTYNYNITK